MREGGMKKSESVGTMRSSDLSRTMTLRNASENRKLVGHLQHLDLQLRNNLVNLQAEISGLRLSRGRQQRPTTPYSQEKTTTGNSYSSPGHLNDRKLRCAPIGISPLGIKRTNSETLSKPFLPQISAKQTALVGKGIHYVERPHPPRSPATSRRRRNEPKSGISKLASGAAANLCRPKSSPDLNMDTSAVESGSGPPTIGSLSALRGLRRGYGSVENDMLVSRSTEELKVSASPAQLNERVRDFLHRPNTGSSEREKGGTNEVDETAGDIIPTINIEQDQTEEINGTRNSDVENIVHEEREFLTDEELFRNSLLLKASRDDGLSRSLPDLSSLGMMDFNEVIDQRLRKLREDLPSEKEMRKIRYLRFRDEPAPLSLKEIFDKDNLSSHEHLDKIDE